MWSLNNENMDLESVNLKHRRYAGIYLHFGMSELTCRQNLFHSDIIVDSGATVKGGKVMHDRGENIDETYL